MTDQSFKVASIYAEYVRMRQSGDSQNDAAQVLMPQADELTASERRQLGQLVQTWENTEGQFFKPFGKPSSKAAPRATPPPPTAPPRRIAAIEPARGADNGPRTPSIASRPAPDEKKICPHCGKTNRQMDTYCYACGHILNANGVATKGLDDLTLDPKTRWGNAHFGPTSTLTFAVRGAAQPLDVVPKMETTIGRVSNQSAVQPDVDLSAFDAENLGVSRLHVTLRRHEDTITVIDLNSRNATFINGQRLHPQEVRVLRDGDEIRLGKLTMKVTFKHSIRRI